MKSQESYQQFCERLRLIPGPEAAKAFAHEVLAELEIKRYYSNEFVASLHPDGRHLAGFHINNVTEDGDE